MARQRNHYYISTREDIRMSERLTGFSHTLNNLEFLKLKEVSFFEYFVYSYGQDFMLFLRTAKTYLGIAVDFLKFVFDVLWFILMFFVVKFVTWLTKIAIIFIGYPIGVIEILIFNKTGDRRTALATWWIFISLMLAKANTVANKAIKDGH